MTTADTSDKLSKLTNWIGNRFSSRTKRRMKVVLAALLLLAVAHGIASFVIGRKVDAEIAKMRAKGEPTSLAELERPKIADNQNAALIYSKAFKLMESKEASASLKTLWYLDRQKEPQPWNKIKQAVTCLDGVMPLLEQAISRPKCQYPIDWILAGWEKTTTFDHLFHLYRLQYFLSAKAMLATHDHNMENALQLVRMELKLSESLSEEPAIISQLVRFRLIEIACESLRYHLQSGAIEPQQAQQLAAELTKINLVPGLTQAMKGSGIYTGLTGFSYFQRHPVDFCIMSTIVLPIWGGGAWALCEASFPGRPFLNADQLFFFRALSQVIRDSKLPYRNFRAKRETLFLQTGYPWYAGVSTLSIPAFCKSVAERDEAEANLALAQVALALSTYRSHYGEYPSNPAELATRLKWKLPEDPFAGKPLGYKKQGKGFLLYSIGQDMIDDGGKKVADRDSGYFNGDIIWKTDR